MFEKLEFLERSNITEIDGDQFIEIVWPDDCDNSEGVWVDREFIYKAW